MRRQRQDRQIMRQKENIILCDCEADEVKDLKCGLESSNIYIYIYI